MGISLYERYRLDQAESQMDKCSTRQPKCYICHQTLTKAVSFIRGLASVLYCILHLLKQNSLLVLNKQIVQLNGRNLMCQ